MANPIGSNNPLPQSVFVPSATGTVEIPLSVRILIAPVASTAKWIWSVIIIRAKKDGLALIPLFLGALGIFPLWISLAMSTTSIVLISLSISKAESKSTLLEQANTSLQSDKKTLETTNQDLVVQKGELQLRRDQLQKEKDGLSAEKDLVSNQRNDAITNKAQIQIQCDQLKEEKRQINEQKEAAQNQNQKLSAERDAALAANSRLAPQLQAALDELGTLRAQISQADDYKQLDENLERFRQLYTQATANQGDMRGATQMALEDLIPDYKASRDQLYKQIQKMIEQLPISDLAQISGPELETIALTLRTNASYIMRLSKRETDHLEGISTALHLFKDLRTTLESHFQRHTFQSNNQIQGAKVW